MNTLSDAGGGDSRLRGNDGVGAGYVVRMHDTGDSRLRGNDGRGVGRTGWGWGMGERKGARTQ